MRHIRRTTLVVLLVLSFVPTLLIAEESGPTIMQRVMDTQSADSSAMDIRLTLIEPTGENRERRIQTLTMTEDGLTNTITVFLSPASVKNTRFLTRQRPDGSDDQWIFLPALGRIKRIAASEGGGSFMGSDFTYADMASTTYDTDEAIHTLLRSEYIDGRDSYVIESIPTTTSDYGKTVIWVDKQTNLPLQVEFYDKEKSSVIKILKTDDIAYTEGRWITKSITMTTLSSGHSTKIEILQAKYDIPMKSGYFTTAFLETGRVI
ncbi:outer membrane lipoprotein-sorting protein [Pleomorphochaeta sp. DL1XJH-081]|uniref:outer membrane lipoprotein-sorting protein n=1 Tax=Pleomorphochaeta sp. DL1XJH-081 TaxID=3409690 RepID=UPI003BB4A38C